MGCWIRVQLKNYINKLRIMKNIKIYNEWTSFMNKYSEYFDSNIEKWNGFMKQVKEYISKNKKRPSSTNKNIIIKILGN